MNTDPRELNCLRCGTEMEFAGREQFQLGEESLFFGVMAVATAQSTRMDVYQCPNCGKVEFFAPGARKKVTVPKTNWTCSECGTYNRANVQNCQGCGINREWMKQKQAEDKY